MTLDGDPQPEDWPVRAHESFVNALWSLVVDEDDYNDGKPAWMEAWGCQQGHVPEPAALNRILACGVDPDDLTDVVRVMQHLVIYNACQLIDDPGLLGIGLNKERSERAEFGWELVAFRAERPTERAPLNYLHSLCNEHDPSGRSGEPRGRPIPVQLPGQPLYARLAVSHALAGDRVQALKTWRKATGTPLGEAKAAIELLLDQLRQKPESTP
ncbi:hypothetical protein ACIRP2_31605 [Streptomyces sp. NPDC101194]|uniref:hypothetical protein n=1 Tax=Streptomyces sp. NPDC101194 TaxID=3366127 RepID=UPI0038059C93